MAWYYWLLIVCSSIWAYSAIAYGVSKLDAFYHIRGTAIIWPISLPVLWLENADLESFWNVVLWLFLWPVYFVGWFIRRKQAVKLPQAKVVK